jgi:exosortase
MRRLIAVYGLLLIVALACWPGALALHELWISESGNTHGYLVLAVSLVLIYQSRERLAATEWRPYWPALALVAAASFVWLVLWRAGLQGLHLLLIPVIAALAVLAAAGWRVLRVLAFPLAFFFFALPTWELVLSGPLQSLTVVAQAVLIQLTGLPARMDGNLIYLEAGAFEVESGCSGLHYLVVGLAIAALYGEISRDPPRLRLIWLAVMGGLALVCNWLRVFIVVVAGYQTNMEHYLVTVEHYTLGWFLFIVLTVLFLWTTSRLPAARARHSDSKAAAQTTVPADGRARVAAAWAGAAACVAAIPAWTYTADLQATDQAWAYSVRWPQVSEPWYGRAPPGNTIWQPRFDAASASSMRAVQSADGRTIEQFGVIYEKQHQGAELLGYENSLLGDEDVLRVLDESIIESDSGLWRETLISGPAGHRSVVISRYHIGERAFVNPIASQIWYGLTALRHPPISSLVALRTECLPDCEIGRERLRAFAAANCPRNACGVMVQRAAAVRPEVVPVRRRYSVEEALSLDSQVSAQ